ncbi:unnamed protein product [Didymodactylos carnosus]|uniref:Endoplasmic reticulum resident protein 44 n=1 Tax=Didymodactylos carnosus TaxID=1234261 RepID=A0A8S2F1A8_9BILA|nr:unnamed protein product [Didymodactylos carnosus]CAF4162294.1 unnamed protein product [Didymodactylos carnosus]
MYFSLCLFFFKDAIATKYHVNKYPTLKMYRHGVMTKKEYRGARQVDPLFEFIKKQVDSSIIKLHTKDDLHNLVINKRYIIGHYENEQSENYQIFAKVASLLRDECNFAASTGSDDYKDERPSGDAIYYRPPQTLTQKDVFYMGPINSHEALYAWANEKCVPLVREITFENAEELTDEGLPFLILFHDQNDHQTVADFEHEVAKQLMHHRATINCLHADGQKFVHPIQHLGKSTADLPLLTIDSFRHMFLFPNIKDLATPGKLLEFVQNLHSGKLHQDFHNPPPPTKEPETTISSANVEKHVEAEGGDTPHLPKSPDLLKVSSSSSDAHQFIQQQKTSPPESVFVHLGPSRWRQISLLGYPGVGKSTLVGQFVYKTFFKEYYPNVESQYDLLVVDNAGADPYTINHSEFHNSDSYIIVYSIDDKARLLAVVKTLISF